jgi:hypothetical protein
MASNMSIDDCQSARRRSWSGERGPKIPDSRTILVVRLADEDHIMELTMMPGATTSLDEWTMAPITRARLDRLQRAARIQPAEVRRGAKERV